MLIAVCYLSAICLLSSNFIIQLDLKHTNGTRAGDMTNYQENGEFSLESFSSEYNITFYSCCPEPYPDITYTIR